AILGVDHLGPASSPMKPELQLALALAEGVLELVPIAPLLDGGLDGLELEALQPAKPPQSVVDLAVLLGKLRLVWEGLPGGTRTGLPSVHTALGDAVRRGTDELDCLSLAEVPLCAGESGTDPITGERAGHEHDVTIRAGDAA